MFFLISGAAATGKKSVVRMLKGKIKDLECHWYNEIQEEDTFKDKHEEEEEWVKRALKAQAEGRDFLLAGHTPFGKLLACPSAIKLNGINCCLLDCHDFVRVERYLDRPQFEEWPLCQDTLCWAVFHRMHAHDPEWEQRVVINREMPGFQWERWTSWTANDERWDVKRIDTTENEMEYTVNLVKEWILEEKQKSQILTPQNKWWV